MSEHKEVITCLMDARVRDLEIENSKVSQLLTVYVADTKQLLEELREINKATHDAIYGKDEKLGLRERVTLLEQSENKRQKLGLLAWGGLFTAIVSIAVSIFKHN